MSDLRERLRRLRREPCGAAPEGDPSAAALPDWFRARGRGRAAPDPAPQSPDGARRAPPAELIEARNELGAFAFRERAFAARHRHGDWSLDEVDGAEPELLALFAGQAERLEPKRAVYLDIETTGLSGGAGVHTFLVGLGTFAEDGFRLWQGFLRGPSEERALLAEVARRVARADAVVSFFGKSFDRHRLEDKMRLHGVAPPFAGRPHLDLYHPSRRLYGATLDDGRLRTLETELLGLRRADDLPGAFAPTAWFDWLAGRPHRVEDVFRHNEDDVLTLVTLAAHLGRAAAGRRSCGRPLSGSPLARAAGLAALLARAGRWDVALEQVEGALAAGPRDASCERVVPELLALRGEALQRAGRPDEAHAAFAAAARASSGAAAARAWIACAKLAEHHLRDPVAARAACAAARERLAGLPAPDAARLCADLDHREARLDRRVGAGSAARDPRA